MNSTATQKYMERYGKMPAHILKKKKNINLFILPQLHRNQIYRYILKGADVGVFVVLRAEENKRTWRKNHQY